MKLKKFLVTAKVSTTDDLGFENTPHESLPIEARGRSEALVEFGLALDFSMSKGETKITRVFVRELEEPKAAESPS